MAKREAVVFFFKKKGLFVATFVEINLTNARLINNQRSCKKKTEDKKKLVKKLNSNPHEKKKQTDKRTRTHID